MVSQAVLLDHGTYVLSWWDQARTASGDVPAPGSTVPKYRAEVYTEGWRFVEGFTGSPYVPAAGAEPWSPRRSLTFVVGTPGVYRIAFGASVPGESANGSVAIAQTQLEVAKTDRLPTAYVPTEASRTVPSRACPRTAADFRAQFDHRCESDGTHCFYELRSPIMINTEDLRDGVSRLEGKLARGNHNFRHITVALNLEGTGVRDCTSEPTTGCFGTGYTEYTLEHDAATAGILDWNGDIRMFDFGFATIQRGKALSAERTISMPISSNDQALLAQPGIEKPELRGRPLDGNYHLRIWDSPSLKWERLDDIQFVLKYRYWSKIERSGSL
jgi:hypothetical protein